MFRIFKYILGLQIENILLKRAINDAAVMLNNRKKHFTLSYNNEDIHFLFQEVYKILSSLNKQNEINNA